MVLLVEFADIAKVKSILNPLMLTCAYNIIPYFWVIDRTGASMQNSPINLVSLDTVEAS